MEINTATTQFASLGHMSRLAIFRQLVQAGSVGLNVSAIAEKINLAPATLSFHLANLNRAGLVMSRQESRFIYYSADFESIDGLLSFLTENCCQGQACLPNTCESLSAMKCKSIIK
jgi:ArsR family transcriptional regulator, arsenate/arsenite/antimonite-responsive transcriptional repressor